MKNLIVILIVALSSMKLSAQTKFTLTGNVKDKTGEALIGSLVLVQELKGVGAVADIEGNYQVTLPNGNYTIKVTSIGYKPILKKVNLNGNKVLDVILEDDTQVLEEVVITVKKEETVLVQAGVEKLDMEQINKIPVLMGERDVLKTIQLLPGVKGAGEGNSGFYVRGGSSDQNLVLLDDAPVYNATHLFGMFSTFNSDVIDGVTLYKGNMPSNYGGRLSSVLDITTLEGNKEKYHTSGSIGLISSKLNVEGPIVKEKGSFMLSGRRTYADLFLKLAPDKDLRSKQLYFYDLNVKSSYMINDKNRIFFTGYYGRDKLRFDKNFGMDWGNMTGTLRWNKIYSPKLLSNTSFVYSDYDYKIEIKVNDATVDLTSKIKSHTLKHEYKYLFNDNSKLVFGLSAANHEFLPGQVNTTDENIIKPVKLQKKYALENAVYVNHEWKPLKNLNLVYGARVSSFSIKGKGVFNIYDQQGSVISTKTLHPEQLDKTYFNFEPRLSASFAMNNSNSLKASYTRNAQNIHLLSGSTSENPTDIWLPSSYNIKPEISNQYALGYMKTLKNEMYELSAETYYKDLFNQIDYRNGASVLANERVEAELLYGIGRAYGLELSLKKKTGKLTGWIAYTLAKTERKIDGINNNQWYNAKQDRTHDISIVGIYDFNKKWSLSATWVYNTGNAVTFPTGKYRIDGKVNYVYSERNASRMPSYHRMDVGVTWNNKKTEKFESSWNLSIYNLYARENAYQISFEQDPNDATRTRAMQTTLFRIIPSINYNFKF